MSIKQTIRLAVLGIVASVAVMSAPFASEMVGAQPANEPACIDAGGTWVERTQQCNGARPGGADGNPVTDGCGGVETAIIKCEQDGSDGELENTGVWGLLLLAINILTAGVGVAALGGIVYGAVLYTSAGGNPDQIKKARNMFTNVVIGVISFAAMYALLQFIIPGGVFQ